MRRRRNRRCKWWRENDRIPLRDATKTKAGKRRKRWILTWKPKIEVIHTPEGFLFTRSV